MLGIVRHVPRTLASALIVICCWGCTGTSQVARQSQSEAPPVSAEQIAGVQMQDLADSTIIRISGRAPLQTPQFTTPQADRFVLDLPGVDATAKLPPLPPSSERVRLEYRNSGSGVQLTGALSSTFGSHTIEQDRNDLVLTLRFSDKIKMATRDYTVPLDADVEYPALKKEKRVSPPMPASKPVVQRVRQTTKAVDTQQADGTGADSALGSDAPNKVYRGKPVSLDFQGADLNNVLRLLAEISGTNIIVEPNVTGRVTLKVTQVPLDQVLDMVVAMNGLGLEKSGNIIRIATRDTLAKEWNEKSNVLKARQQLMEVSRDVGDVATVYLPVSYGQIADLAEKITAMKSERGKIATDARTSLIIYTDFPARIEAARRLLARLDKPIPQVLIEARIVTLTSDVTRNLGITWNASTTYSPGTELVSQSFALNGPPISTATLNVAQMFGETLLEIDATLTALETASEVNIIASPKVLTLDNVEAVVSQGASIPYRKLNESGVTSTEFVDAVVQLKVVPHITPDRKVRLKIDAKQDEPSATVVGEEGTPGIDTQSVTTELLVDDGNIIVIGGVMRDNETKTKQSTPGLSEIPLLGALFKNTSNRKQKRELLIFISPKIVEPSTASLVK